MLLPILNGSFDNLNNDKNATYLTPDELTDTISTFFSAKDKGGEASNLFASINGKDLQSLFDYRQSSEEEFAYSSPSPVSDSLLSQIGYSDDTYLLKADGSAVQLKDLASDGKLTIDPAISDGYWLAIDIQGAAQDLRFGSALGAPQNPFFSLDTTYQVLNPIS